MKKILLVLFLVFVGAIGVNTATASAASCSVSETATYWETPYLKFIAYIQPCTGVDQIQMHRQLTPGSGQFSGWHDLTNGGSYISYGPTVYTFGRVGVAMPQGAAQVFYHSPWCGGAVHAVKTSVLWRIHNQGTNTWGQWYYTPSSTTAPNC